MCAQSQTFVMPVTVTDVSRGPAPLTQSSSTRLPDDASGENTPQELVIRARRGWIAIDWSELLRYRELLFFLVWRDIKVRYKQTVLGVAWAVLQPVLSVAIFSVIFGAGFGMKDKLPPGLPFPLYVFLGVIAWQVFAGGLNSGGLSLVSQQHLLTKIYFPRLFVPTAAVGGLLVDMAIALGVFAVVMLYFGYAPAWTVIFLPLLVVLNVMCALGIAYLLSALTVSYRDFRFLIPFMTQIWMWVSFVAFPVPESIRNSPKWQWVLALNPMYGIISAYRRAVLGLTVGWNPLYLMSAIGITLALFTFGLFYFRRTERRFADIA